MCLFGESSLSRVRHYRVIFRQQCYVFCRGGRRFFFQVGCFCSVRSHRDSAFISDAAFFGAAAGIALCVSCPKKVLYTEPFTFHLSPLLLQRQLHTRSDKGYGSLSVWFVDSAVRWRCNGAGELIRNSCFWGGFCAGFCGSAVFAIRRLALFAVVFFGDCFLQLAVLREPQPPSAEARRFGCRRPPPPQASFRESVRCKFASFASVGAVLFSCRSQRREFCEPP